MQGKKEGEVGREHGREHRGAVIILGENEGLAVQCCGALLYRSFAAAS